MWWGRRGKTLDWRQWRVYFRCLTIYWLGDDMDMLGIATVGTIGVVYWAGAKGHNDLCLLALGAGFVLGFFWLNQ